MGRFIAFLYGLVAYSFSSSPSSTRSASSKTSVCRSPSTAVRCAATRIAHRNLVLLSIFAIQHSVMARPQFKQWWLQFVPKSVERSTYVLLASLALVPAVLAMARHAGRGLAGRQSGSRQCGDCTFVCRLADRAGQHFHDQSLRTVWPAPGLQQSLRPIHAETRSRRRCCTISCGHPIYLGFIIAFWAAPTMTVGHLLFAAVTTAYIFVGIFLESTTCRDVRR